MFQRAVVFLVTVFLICPAGLQAAAVEEMQAGYSYMQIDRTDFPDLYLSNPYLRGDAVWMVQARLRELKYYDKEPDGIYDFATREAVSLFQVAHGLEDTGIVTKPVWEALMFGEGNVSCLAAEAGDNTRRQRILIIVDVATRRLTLYEDEKEVAQYPVAVGKSKTPTPLGEWKIVHKGLHWGGGFGTRWMGLNVPWGVYGIHGTNNPGSIGTYASHGCIRMFNQHVEELYPRVPLGTRVKIVENGRLYPEDLNPVTLKKNAVGQKVVYVQSRLKELGLEFDRADGRFGNMTELAVKYFQVWHGMEPTGVVDEDTYRALGMI
ncbi:MAG: peptidoglycan-binding protein [Syntrophomonadaceae bacterium]|nr:peptidoglycan-binding protein [Syntrophomonadaceae bacterium]